MPANLNLGQILIDSAESNGSVNFGKVVHNSNHANAKMQGWNMSIGDFSFTSAQVNNKVVDIDILDQTDVFNPSNPFVQQS